MSTEIKKIIEEILQKMSVQYSDVLIDESQEKIRFVVKTDESALLIGSGGENLKAFNYIIKRIYIGDDFDKKAHFVVDIEDYYLQKIEKLKYTAKIMAERVRFLKEDAEMEPMSSYERLVVHSALADEKDIKTESTGVGRSRRIVIKYLPENDTNDVEENF